MLQSTTIQFLTNLKQHNNKEWFEQNRKTYEAAKADYLAFVTKVLQELQQIDSTLAGLEPKQCVFRINRDVRFSKDKSPYKTNMGASFSEGGKKVMLAGYYFHCEPGQSFIGGGLWMPMAPELKKVRQEIDYCFDEFNAIVKAKPFQKLFGGLDQSKEYILSRPPKGYEIDNPAIDYLKLKSFIASAPISDADLTNKQLVKKVIHHFETMMPLIQFLNRALAG
jgi:uncharacterized protein (TIGR02453 family)